MRTVWSCLRHDWTIAYRGPISVQGAQRVTALLNFSGSVLLPTNLR